MSDNPGTGTCPACKTEKVRLKDVGGLMICDKCSSKRFSNKVRKSIQEAFERQQEQRRREAWQKRIEVARRGVKHFEDGKLPEALRCFRDYIAILELRYNCGFGGLHPDLFDKKKDGGELLLISGIYWDMAKIYDQMKNHQADLRTCLNKFIEFSLDKPHMILASEALRRHIAVGKPRNVQDFKNAHQLVVSHLARCFIASTVYGVDSEEVEILRTFRDESLSKHSLGRVFIETYYRMSPPVAKFLLSKPLLAATIKVGMTPLVRFLSKHKN